MPEPSEPPRASFSQGQQDGPRNPESQASCPGPLGPQSGGKSAQSREVRLMGYTGTSPLSLTLVSLLNKAKDLEGS